MSIPIYCARHRAVERFTDVEAERFIHALLAANADADTEPDGGRPFAGDDSSTHLYERCVTDQAGVLQDSEMYYEHVECMHDARVRFGRPGAQS